MAFFLTNILCCNCPDRNETLVRELHKVRENFKSSRKAIAEEKGGTTSVADCDTGKEVFTCNSLRALFV